MKNGSRRLVPAQAFFGSSAAAGVLPAVYIMRFTALASSLMVVMVLRAIQYQMHLTIANLARRVFFTVVAREEKNKAKNRIGVGAGGAALRGAYPFGRGARRLT